MDEQRVDSTFDLLRRAQGGDEEALDRLFARYLPALSRWASGRLPRWCRDLMDTDAQFPLCEPVIERVALAKLSEMVVPTLTTLYVPPRPQRALDERIMRWFDEA